MHGQSQTKQQLLNQLAELRQRIAELETAEAERKQAKERLRLQAMLLEQVQDTIVATDLEGRITYVNQAVARTLGVTKEELIGQTVLTFGENAEKGATQQEIIDKTLANGAWCGKVINYDRDGSERIMESRTWLVRDDRGVPKGMVGISTDITAREQMEKQLWRQERLAAVGQLAAGIAHDFRNLLTTIILHAQIPLRRPDLPSGLVQSLKIIVDESHKATDLVQQILDFSSRSMIDIRSIDLGILAEGVLGIWRRTTPENVRLLLDIPPTEASFIVKGDSGRVAQALTNLVLNACDAMPEGGELRIELSNIEIAPGDMPPVADMPPGEWVCMAVSDTGTGMTDEVQAHLFEPFFTTKEPGKGTGLGLAQVYGIIRQHEGYIGVETEVGKGTTFRIYLPASEVQEESVAKESSARPQGQGETILLVEDEEKVRDAGRSVLESLGYRVMTAANGREALELYRSVSDTRPDHGRDIRSRRVDLVITDIVMPEMGGKELVQELRKKTPDLKVLAITGYAMLEGLEELQAAGFSSVVQKPFNVETLAQATRRALDAKRKR